jgi:hypothetical protein
MMTTKLDEHQARTDFTSREVAKILSSLVGGLVGMSTADEVRTAVRWLAENEEIWTILKACPPPVAAR